MAKKFWMVFGSGAPTYRHYDKDAAQREAERLATQFPEQEFVVLESLASAKFRQVAWTKHDDEDDESSIPF